MVPTFNQHMRYPLFKGVRYFCSGDYAGHTNVTICDLMELREEKANFNYHARVLANWSNGTVMIAERWNPINFKALIMVFNGVVCSTRQYTHMWNDKKSDGNQLFYNMVMYAGQHGKGRKRHDEMAMQQKMLQQATKKVTCDVTIEFLE